MNGRPVVQIVRQGNIGNRMIQLMVATALARRVPGCVVADVRIPEYGIDLPPIPFRGGRVADINWHRAALDDLAGHLIHDRLDGVVLSGYGQRVENFPPLDVARDLFGAADVAVEGYGADALVINIRAAEILSGAWENYTLVPLAFYAELIAGSGLQPVFMGQLGDDAYSTALRRSFPNAVFRPSEGAVADFEILRRSRNVVVSVSTFAWLAAWLSHAERIVVPMTGFLNPFQDTDVDLIPTDDSRFEFHLFPVNYAAPIAELDQAHATIAGQWRRLDRAAVARLKRDAPRFGAPTTEQIMEVFDAAYYLALNPDVAEAVHDGRIVDARSHFLNCGLREGRRMHAFNKVLYGRSYPMAAIEVGQGDYASLHDHYVSIGRHRGYGPCA